ncbi:hypothetical protein C0V75_22255 [Tabrizicola sp. TH137]|nr:hypothetical protein C0V75_22255 [Tabrizicola sp. TH137]
MNMIQTRSLLSWGRSRGRALLPLLHPRTFSRMPKGSGHDFPGPDWADDPLSHPDIFRMTERERADLPFDPPTLTR